MPRTIVTPGDQWRTAQETRAAWLALRNQAYGRGVEPRAVPEAARDLQAQILTESDRFAAWWDRITVWDVLLPVLVSELGEWRDIYNALSARWSDAMRATVVQLPQVQGPGSAVVEEFEKTGRALVAPGGGLFWLAVIGGGIWFLTRPSGGQRRKKGA